MSALEKGRWGPAEGLAQVGNTNPTGGRPRLRSTGTRVDFSATELQGMQERAWGTRDSGAPHSYDQYARSDASVGINIYSAQKIEEKKSRVADIGIGTGGSLIAVHNVGLLTDDFIAVGLDFDRTGLEQTRETFKDYNAMDLSDRMILVQGTGEQFPIASESVDLVLCLNTIHLFDNPNLFFEEAFRVLEPGQDVLVNSAYVKDSIYANKKSQDAVRSMFIGAARYVERKGVKRGATFDPARFTKEEYEQMAKNAGFVNVQVEIKTVNMSQYDIAAIFATHEFEDGALPGVPYEIARRGLVGSIKSRLKRFGIETIDRNWMVLVAKKPLAAAA